MQRASEVHTIEALRASNDELSKSLIELLAASQIVIGSTDRAHYERLERAEIAALSAVAKAKGK